MHSKNVEYLKKQKTKKYLGQHFLKNKQIINKIVNAIDAKYKNIYEIGPGAGALTYALLEKFNVKAIEIDKDCIANFALPENLHENLQVIEADILEYKFSEIPECVVGNLPYNIGTQILRRLMFEKMQTGLFMLQKEVAERVSGVSYGRLSVFIQACYDVEKIVNVPGRDFTPAPKVESQVIKLKRNDKYVGIDLEKLDEILKIVFANRRKKLSGLKKTSPQIIEHLLKLNIDLNLRAENVPKEIYYQLAFAISSEVKVMYNEIT